MWGILKGIRFADIARQNQWETASLILLAAVFVCVDKKILPESSIAYGLGLTFIGFLIGFFVRLRGYRLISGTATSKISSAAQGFTELSGRVVRTGTELRTPFSKVECAWYKHIVEEKRIDHKTKSVSWHFVSEECSHLPISVTDGSGENVFVIPNTMLCLYMPHTTRIEDDSFAFGIGDYRHTEFLLKEGDQVLINGSFATHHLNGLRAARHLLGANSDLEQIKDIQKTIRYQVSQQLGLNGKDEIDQTKIHVISPCPKRKSGLIAYGKEKDILGKKVWLIGLRGALAAGLLVVTVIAAEHFSEKAINQYEKGHSLEAAAFSDRKSRSINADR